MSDQRSGRRHVLLRVAIVWLISAGTILLCSAVFANVELNDPAAVGQREYA